MDTQDPNNERSGKFSISEVKLVDAGPGSRKGATRCHATRAVAVACVVVVVLCICVLTPVFVMRDKGKTQAGEESGVGPESRSRSRGGGGAHPPAGLHRCEYQEGSDNCTCPDGQVPLGNGVACMYDLDLVLHESLLFYESQRSGPLPDDNRIPWRGDSALNDMGENGEDLTGGYYDAGDTLKLGLPMAYTATVLTWGFIEFRDAYEAAGEVDSMLACIKWFTDYFIKCHTAEHEFYVQVGTVASDHESWGRPEDMTMSRTAYKVDEDHPGSDCVGGTAAAMAAASMAFRDYDVTYSNILLTEARSLYRFAYDYRGKYSDSVTDAESTYPSRKYEDELVWAAVWLYRATEEQSYLDDALGLLKKLPNNRPYAFSWGDVTVGYRLLLFKITGDRKYAKLFTKKFVDAWKPPRPRVPYTPDGQAWRSHWGSLRYSTSTAFIALMAAHYGEKTSEYIDWAKEQVYIPLGETGRSFVVGFGVHPPEKPHHRGSSCPDPPEPCNEQSKHEEGPNPHVLTGALVGGPDRDGSYTDDRNNIYLNEVTLDYNAGFQSAVAALRHFQLNDML